MNDHIISMDKYLNDHLSKDNKDLILRNLLGFDFKIARSIYITGGISRITYHNNDDLLSLTSAENTPYVSIENGKIIEGEFKNIFFLAGTNREGLIYVTQTNMSEEHPRKLIIIASSKQASSPFNKNSSTKKTPKRKKRSTKKTPKRKKRSTKKTPKRNPRRV